MRRIATSFVPTLLGGYGGLCSAGLCVAGASPPIASIGTAHHIGNGTSTTAAEQRRTIMTRGAGPISPTTTLLHKGTPAAVKTRANELLAERPYLTSQAAINLAYEQLGAERPKGKRGQHDPTASAQRFRRVDSSVVDALMHKMAQKGLKERIKNRVLTEEERAEVRVRNYVATRRLAGNRIKKQRIGSTSPIDHLSLTEIYDYLSVALKGGEVSLEGRRQIPMSMRMAAGERHIEVPPPSFIYVLLQHDPNLLQEAYHPRITFAVEQWVKLPLEQRQYFVDHPLKGISE